MEEMTVNQVAELLGKSDRTIRNYVKEGRIKARHVENQFSWEYRVYDLGEFAMPTKEPTKAEKAGIHSASNSEPKTERALQITNQENLRLWEEIRQLREVNNRLAYDLGARDQRIKDLEIELGKERNQLPAGQDAAPVLAARGNGQTQEAAKISPKPWWKRFFRL